MTAMKLYWAPRTRSLIALWALEESGLAYERVLIDIRAGAQNDPAFKAINPMAKVPALEDGAARLAENAATCSPRRRAPRSAGVTCTGCSLAPGASRRLSRRNS